MAYQDFHPENITYRPDIDGLRAVAILSVVLFHTFPMILPGGFTGVDIFFVISGFLISSIILKNMDRKCFSFLDFYARRIKRLFPALILVLAVCLFMGWLLMFPDEFKLLGKHTLAGAGFFANFQLLKGIGYFDLAASQKPLLHLWSLGIEEQFYLIWPVIIFFIHKCPKWMWQVIVILLFLSFFMNIYYVSTKPTHAFYLPWNRFWELLFGSGLAYLRLHRLQHKDIKQSVSSFFSILGIILIGVGFCVINKSESFPGFWALMPTLGAFFLILAGPNAFINRYVLSSKPFVAIGLISYPLYLWHWPVLSFLALVGDTSVQSCVVAILLSFVLAFATYYLAEKPIRYRNNSVSKILLFVMSLFIVLGLCVDKKIILPAVSLNNKTKKIAFAVDDWGHPGKSKKSTYKGRKINIIGTNQDKVLFIGDSNMDHFYPRIEKLIEENLKGTRSAIFMTAGNCLPIPGVIEKNGTNCLYLAETALELAADPDISTVVISSLWTAHLSNTKNYFVDKDGKKYDISSKEGLEFAYTSFGEMLRKFKEMGKQVHVILNIPTLSEQCPHNMLKRSLNGNWEVKASQGDRATWDKMSNEIFKRLTEISLSSGAQVINPVESLCDESHCFTLTMDQTPLYRDDCHLTASYVREHVSFLDHIMRPVLP